MVKRVSSAGVGYATADLSQVRYIFASAVPRAGGDLYEQARDALHTIEELIRGEDMHAAIIRQAVFLHDPDEYETCKQIIAEFYGDQMPATAYVVQPPCEEKLLAIEAWGVARKNGDVAIDRVSDNLVIVHHSGLDIAHCAGIVPQTDEPDVYTRSRNAFDRMTGALAARGFRFDQVIRTWLYLGDIVGPEGETQRYKELNRARADFYEDIRFLEGRVPATFDGAVYPASTGIGASDRNVMMGCVGLQSSRDDLALLPLENPQQTSAFAYEAGYSPKSPKFSRAMAAVVADTAAILVSGTASIVHSQTRHVGDVEKQTAQTIDNIEALIAEPNFARYGFPGLGATLDDLALCRVYIKHKEDYAKTRAICEARLGELPTIYAVADVCRPDLLVELEGVAFVQRR